MLSCGSHPIRRKGLLLVSQTRSTPSGISSFLLADPSPPTEVHFGSISWTPLNQPYFPPALYDREMEVESSRANKACEKKLFFLFHLLSKGLCAKRDSLKCWFSGLGRRNVPSWVMVAEVQNERNVWLGKGQLSSEHQRMSTIQAISQRVQTIGRDISIKSET